MGLGQDSAKETTETDAGENKVLAEDGGKEDGEGIGHDMAGKGDEDGKEQHGNEQLGLPVGSLGQEYSLETDSKIKKDKLLAEEFDGYLGSMDRYYNHYILIPGGEYIIGSKHPKKDEKPEQMVYLEPFYFGRFPVTNGLFEIFIEKTGYKTTAEKVGYGTVYYGRFEKKKDETTGLITSTWNSSLYYKTVDGACWYQPSGPKSTLYNKRNHPVVQISMEDAMAFAAWTGKRLPTENEWEAASRTANGWGFPWGTEWKKNACNIEDSYTADTTPVDKHAEFENDFGIVDTMGNVLEWTNDGFDSTSKNNHGAKYRAVKGGSWISGNDIRLFNRFLMEPESHSNVLGFRCVAY
jgi:formylglycine-generating enzyme required for sulfatase activity